MAKEIKVNIKKKILTDENNHPIAVQIDYQDWLEFEKILKLHAAKSSANLEAFSGKITLSEDPLSLQKKIREEWP